jgi:ubiquinone/menaquinone biosynthesis C-methylase UbiE
MEIRRVLGRILSLNPALGKMQEPNLSRILNLNVNDIFVDIGCGSGWFTWRASRFCTSIGLDINSNALKKIYVKSKNLHLLIADALNIPLRENVIDKILLSGTLQVIEEENKLLKECYRILRGSLLLITVVTQHLLIKRIYECRSNLIKHLFKQFKYPLNYKTFIDDRIRKLNMTKYHTIYELRELLIRNGFRIVGIQYAPKTLGSLIMDLLLLLLYRWTPSTDYYLFFLYPYLRVIDKLGDGEEGNYIIIAGRKV